MELKDMIRDMIASRSEVYDQAKAILDTHASRGVFADDDKATEYERLNSQLAEFDERIEELIGIDKGNEKADRQRAPYENVVRPDAGGRGVWSSVHVNTGKTRGKSDTDLALRDFLTGREPQRFVDLDFSKMEHRRTDDGKIEVRDLTTGSGSGGLVGADFRRVLYQHLVEENALLNAGALVVNTDHGRDIEMPKSTVRGTAVITGEGSALSEGDGGFGSVTLGAWKYGRLQQATFELLQDSEVDLTSYLARDMARAVAKAAGAHFITGDGSNKPNGIITATLAQVGTSVQGTDTTIEADNLIDLFYSVDTPYRERGSWLMNAQTFGVVRKLKDSNLNYLMGSLGGSGSPTILGRPVVIDPAVAAVGSANISVGFGDLGAYAIRQAPVRIERSDGYAFNQDLATWRVLLRTDGDLLDATGAFKVADTDG